MGEVMCAILGVAGLSHFGRGDVAFPYNSFL